MSLEDNLYPFLGLYKRMPNWIKAAFKLPLSRINRGMSLGSHYDIFRNLCKEAEEWDKDKITTYQFINLKKILFEVSTNVPFYQKQWAEHQVDLGRIQDLQDFSKIIPVITRDQVQNSPELFLSKKYGKKEVLSANTGGSSGIPLSLHYLKGYSRAAEWAHMHTQWARVGFQPGARLARLRGDYIGKNQLFTFDPYRNFLILNTFNLDKVNARSYLKLLEKYKIEYINAYPSAIYNLMQLSDFQEYKINSLKAILLGSENIYQWQVDRIREFFNIEKITYWYGHGELCALAGKCSRATNYHFYPTYSYVEFMPIEQDIEDKNIFEIVGTTFINPAMPLIRYRTQDLASMPANVNCSCRLEHIAAEKIIGREQDIAVGINGEKITLTALIFARHANFFNHVRKIQVINTKPGYLTVKIATKSSFNKEHESEIIRKLSSIEGMPFNTEVIYVPDIEGTKRGKHKFFIKQFDN